MRTNNIAKNIKYKLHPSILRAYDIRGIAGETLMEEDAYMIGRAFAGNIIRETGNAQPHIAIARDGRKSSPALKGNLEEGLKSAGAIVTDFGIGPTPMLYFAVYHKNLDGGIMVTGSHNPPTHNGFKMMIGKKSFYGEDIQKLGRMVAEGDFVDGDGEIKQDSIFDEYIAKLLSGLENDSKSLKVAFDPGNGAAGEVVEVLCEKVPAETIVINGKIDGTFPAHHPDPTVAENLEQLIDVVKENNCDFGVAFDGDGDRIGAVDSSGRVIWGDQLMVLFARDVLKDNPGATVIADVKASQILFDDIAANGGKPIMWKTGHSLVKAKIAEEKAMLAGEMSGHIFFADKYPGFDDGIYAAVRLINILAVSDKSLEEIIDELPDIYNTPEIRIDTTEERKFAIIDEIRDRLAKAGEEEGIESIIDVDGLRVNTKHGWWLVRASNTQPAIVLRCEAPSPNSLEILKSQAKAHLAKSGVVVKI